MPNNLPCKTGGAQKACRNLAHRHLLTLAPLGPELLLLTTLEVLLWIA